jgi:hypothetical protein
MVDRCRIFQYEVKRLLQVILLVDLDHIWSPDRLARSALLGDEPNIFC